MNDQPLTGKVALVTGASSGIGEATAKALAARGAAVAIAARRLPELRRVAADITADGGIAIPLELDVTIDDNICDAVNTVEDQFGGLDIAFNNAGRLGAMGKVADQHPAEWADDITTILNSTFLSMRHEIPALLRRGGGAIINNASHLGVVGFGGGISSYIAAKHGVVGLTKAAALEYAEHNVRVNALALATVDTPMYRSSVGGDPQMAEAFRSLHPLGRIATVEEAAAAVVYLADDAAAFYTGTVLVMDGGWTAQ